MIFWQTRRHNNYGVFILFIALGIIASVAIIIALLISRPVGKEAADTANAEENFAARSAPATATEQTPRGLRAGYEEEAAKLQSRIAAEENISDALFADIENFFLTVRVPKEKLDDHLQALFSFREIKDNQGVAGEIKGELLKLLSEL